jgi:tRNA(Arg) A34 adenosine deaminase TadA
MCMGAIYWARVDAVYWLFVIERGALTRTRSSASA